MTKSHPTPRWQRAGGYPARRVSRCGRYAWSFVIGWAMVPFLSDHGNAQSRCDSPSCDCRDGQATPCDAVGGMGPRPFQALMLPSLAEATLRNTDRLGNSLESTTRKWIERTKQLSSRWRFSESSCDAVGAGSRACGFEHPPITSAPVEDVEAAKSSPLHPLEWPELPISTGDSIATPQSHGPSHAPVQLQQTPEATEIPQPNKQNPLIDPFVDDPQQPVPIIPQVQGKPLGQKLHQRTKGSTTPSTAIDVPPVWIASRPAANRRATTVIDSSQQLPADSQPVPSDAVRQASDSQPIRDPATSASSKGTPQTPRNKKRPKPFESNQLGQPPAPVASAVPTESAPLSSEPQAAPTPSMQSYEEFAKRLQASRTPDVGSEKPASQPPTESPSTATSEMAPAIRSEGQSHAILDRPLVSQEHPTWTSESSVEAANSAPPPESPDKAVDTSEAGEILNTSDEEASNSIRTESTMGGDPNSSENVQDDSVDASQLSEKLSRSSDSDLPIADAEAILDARITQRILNQLQIAKDQGSLKQFELDVSTVGGEVWVRGFVSRPEHKKLIFDTIQKVPGIVVVIDDVSVARPTPASREHNTAEESSDKVAAEEEPTSKTSKSSDRAKAPERGLALPKWLRPKATSGEKENTDFRSTLQTPAASSPQQESAALTPRVRTRGTFGASGGSARPLRTAPLSSPVVPVKPSELPSVDRSKSGQSTVAVPPAEMHRRESVAPGMPDSRADIDRKTKARLATTATRIDQPTAESTAPSNPSLPTPPAEPAESPAAMTRQGTEESTSEQGLDLNSFLQRVNAAKQAKDRPE